MSDQPKPAPQEPSAEESRCPWCDDSTFCGHPFHGVDALREENTRLSTALDDMRAIALDALACWQGEDERRYASVAYYHQAATARGRLRDRMVTVLLSARAALTGCRNAWWRLSTASRFGKRGKPFGGCVRSRIDE